jgi:hypothetical protein
MHDLRIFRVTVRGRFFELSPAGRQQLFEALDDHQVTKSAYTGEGTFTYDSNIYAFSLRYEIRVEGDDPDAVAAELGLSQAEAFLRTLDIGYQQLKVTTTDMPSMWDAAATQKDLTSHRRAIASPSTEFLSLNVQSERRPSQCRA